jgi:two-component system sensor histidine kinase AtoS
VADSTLLQMRNIHYSYGGFEALRGVDLDIRAGEVHAIVGEHRAGKSTLMRILGGNLVPDKGEIVLKGRPVLFATPQEAMFRGIGMVYQSLMVIPSLNAVENIYSGRMPGAWLGYRRYGKMLIESRRLLKELGQEFNLLTPISDLSVAQQQMVEVARILALSPDILILDEISNRLNDEELVHLFRILADYRKAGKSIIYITQNFDEIFELADRVTVIQEGYRKSTETVADLDRMRLYRLAFDAVLETPGAQGRGAPEEERQLLALRRYNRSLIEDLPIGVMIVDREGTVYQANQSAAGILGAKPAELVGKKLGEFRLSEDKKLNDDIMTTLSERGKGAWEGVSIGTAKFVKARILPLHDEDYSYLGALLTLEDASLSASVKEYLTEAEKHQYTAELAAGVAHEVNNPLGIINNYLELLKLKERDDDSLVKLEKIQKEIRRITEIVGSLLSFSRLPGKNEAEVSLVELLDEVLLLLGHRFAEKRIKLEKRFQTDPARITGDENRLKQVFINLLMNSLEAVLDEGSIAVEITKAGRFLRVRVSDNGHGIPLDIEGSVFQPFFTTKLTKTNTGLGLSICDHIVKAHGGTLSYESTPGEWTSFDILLPRTSRPAAQ